MAIYRARVKRFAVRPVDEKFDVFDTATNETMIGGFTTGWNAQQNADARNNELTMTGRIVPPFNLQE